MKRVALGIACVLVAVAVIIVILTRGQNDDSSTAENLEFGTEKQKGFTNDNVLHSDIGDIHFSSYIPDTYDGSEAYALFVTLPGWEGLYFQGVGANMAEDFGPEAIQYNDKMIILSTQLDDWGETSADMAIELTEYFLEHYNIDREKVYLHGMSGGGETGSLVMGKRPDLYTAYLMTSSKWDGDLAMLAKARTPVYMVIGEDDSYYGSNSLKEAYATLQELYKEQGFSQKEIDRLVVLDVKDAEYFAERGYTDQHMGGGSFAYEEDIMGWLFGEHERISKNMSVNRLPEQIMELPDEYYEPMEGGGSLENLNYTTYESFSYEEKSQTLKKRAVVYLPAGYDESKQYNVLYLMHGGWSDETTYLGSPEKGRGMFTNVLDHAIANGEVDPLIVVAPTYNNTSSSDSGDYSLAIQLTNQYHNELKNDLIPAVTKAYSTYDSRDHRAFAGFSMGSVQTWRTFQYNLDDFRYFMPSSGNAGSSGAAYAKMVRNQGYTADDFFIFAASGTNDFAYSSFKAQVQTMAGNDMFTVADNEEDGNLYFLEKEGYSHDGYAAMTYFYNGLTWLFKEGDEAFTTSSTVADVMEAEAFDDYGRLLFPIDLSLDEEATLEEISNNSTYVWYNYIQPEKTVEIVNYLKEQSESGNQIFYPIYSEDEIVRDPSKADTGLFFFRGTPGEKFAVMNAGGGFAYVGAMHDSFPHALEASKNGYNAFALIYRPDDPYSDLARAITYIHDHAEELQVNPENYSLWGGSAGARMAATLGNRSYLYQLTGRRDIPQASAVIMQYTGYSNASAADAPTYVNVGTSDGIASFRTMQRRLQTLEELGVPTEFHSYKGLPHGYGLGTGTVAEGWTKDAFAFWEGNSKGD